jgi:hypothetical protein
LKIREQEFVMAAINALNPVNPVKVRSAWAPPAPARAARAVSVAMPAVRQDMHFGVYKAFAGCWAALYAVFAGTFIESPYTMYLITVAMLTGVMFFGLPYVLSRVGAPATPAGSFLDFLRGRVDTIYGPVSGMEALTQVIMVPVALTLGAIVISSVVHFEADAVYMLYAF